MLYDPENVTIETVNTGKPVNIKNISRLSETSIRKRNVVRVKRDGVVIVEYRANVSVAMLKQCKTSKHLDALWLLCHQAGVTWPEFVALFDVDEKYMWDNLTL